MVVGVAVAQSPVEVAVGSGTQNPTEVAAGGDAATAKTETMTVTATTEGASSSEINVVPTTPAKPVQVAPVRKIEEMVVDTLPTVNEALKIVLYNDNTWRYVRDRSVRQDSTVFEKYWSSEVISPYREVPLASLPVSVVIPLVDSLKSYHYPYKGRIISRYGPRRNRNHNGVDIPLKEGEPIYATFDGRVRYSKDSKTGYGQLVIIRHDNGLETYMGHLSKRLVKEGDWVTAGQVIGEGGSTGRSTGPHLHFEARYYGQSFDPERLIDFNTGMLRRETFLLKRKFFDIYSRYDQNFDDEIANEEDDKREAAELAARRYYKVRSGDTLSGIAVKYGTTVTRICQLNGINRNAILKVGKTLRVK
ncbi:MAG: peptidoglycan DD-metalloendopeptidase family protein [Alistipes sp.]|nr:peptidoglycan DD-metalloendopeptidase family protein [Alistipes sp.]